MLATHLLPLGPHAWGLNDMTGPMGMSLFFTLSGFLITSFLLRRLDIRAFLIRRVFRILPAAYLYIIPMMLFVGVGWRTWLANLFFYTNYDYLFVHNSHFWSLCTEMHFYLGIALLAALLGKRGLRLIPLLCLGVTAMRVHAGAHVNINTHLRVDEILAGGWLALIYFGGARDTVGRWIGRVPVIVFLLMLAAASHPATGWFQYLRPYCGALLVGATLFAPDSWASNHLKGPVLAYIGKISYALYIWHGLIRFGWFDSGSKVLIYFVKRPIGGLLVLGIAHVSTFYWEARWIALARKWTSTSAKRPAPVAADAGAA